MISNLRRAKQLRLSPWPAHLHSLNLRRTPQPKNQPRLPRCEITAARRDSARLLMSSCPNDHTSTHCRPIEFVDNF